MWKSGFSGTTKEHPIGENTVYTHTSLKKPKRVVDKEYREFIRRKKCIFCGHEPPNFCCHAHAGGMGTKCSDYLTFPGCYDCHIEYDSGRSKMLSKHPKIDLEAAMNSYKEEFEVRSTGESLIF